MAMYEIDIEGAEQKMCHNGVDDIWMGGKPNKFNKVQHSTLYATDGLEEEKEEVEGTVHSDGGDKVNIVPFVYPRGTDSVSSLSSF